MTAKQIEVINRYKELNADNNGNVIIRWCGDYNGMCFVKHEKGTTNGEVLERKINARVINALDALGLIIPVDKFHNDMKSANDLKYSTDENFHIGARIVC